MPEPDRQIIVVEAAIDNLVPTAVWLEWVSINQQFRERSTYTSDVCNMMIVRMQSCHDTDSSWAAKRRRSVVASIGGSLIDEESLHIWHVVQRVHTQVLVIGKDENNVLTPAILLGTDEDSIEKNSISKDG